MTDASTPIALRLSIAAGVIGVTLFLIGAIADSQNLFLAGFSAGIVSLIFALVWRGELITTWRANKHR